MTCSEVIGLVIQIISLIAIVVIPIKAVRIGQRLQNDSERRRDKLEIFKTLMIARNSLTSDSVRALNIIEIVFDDDKNVRQCWKEYYKSLCINQPDKSPEESELQGVKFAQDKLLEAIAHSLGYKNITWETIQNAYMPTIIQKEINDEREFKQLQLELARCALSQVRKPDPVAAAPQPIQTPEQQS